MSLIDSNSKIGKQENNNNLIKEGTEYIKENNLKIFAPYFISLEGTEAYYRKDYATAITKLSEALKTYTILTVGDGLVSQVPALIVSTAAGMLVSKAGVEGSADKALIAQLSANPTVLGLSAFLMFILFKDSLIKYETYENLEIGKKSVREENEII